MVQRTTTVVLQPRSSSEYYGYHLAGLEALRGPLRLRFDRHLPAPAAPSHGIALVVDGRKLWIDGADRATIDDTALEWCDAYGVVNASEDAVARSPKVVPIGPSFGIRRGSTLAATAYAVRAGVADRASPRRIAALGRDAARGNRARVPIGCYRPGPDLRSDLVFYATTAWNRHEAVAEPRARFIRAAQALPMVTFEGGFVPQRGGALPVGIDPTLAASGRIDLATYLVKLQQSLCTFDAPAVHGCMSWKLGEALALGKATIAVANDNVPPAPLLHGEHLHRVADDEQALGDAIATIASDPAYRSHLEHGARTYWERWLAPDRMVARLLEHA